jgi:hypothetical protein
MRPRSVSGRAEKAETLCEFEKDNVETGTLVVTDEGMGNAGLESGATSISLPVVYVYAALDSLTVG